MARYDILYIAKCALCAYCLDCQLTLYSLLQLHAHQVVCIVVLRGRYQFQNQSGRDNYEQTTPLFQQL